jgi:hypothetical protein
MTATIDAKSADGESFQIVLEKRGADTGKIEMRQWAAGADPKTAPPAKHEAIDVYNVRVNAAGDRLTCKGKVILMTVTITCLLTPPAADDAPMVNVTVTSWLGTLSTGDYILSLGEYAELRDFILTSGFSTVA